MTLGIAMNGLEEDVLDYAKRVARNFDEITYVEIGVGEGATLTAIACEIKDSGKPWRAIGIELPNGYSFNRARTENCARERFLQLNFITPNSAIVHPVWGAVTVYFKDSQSFLTEYWQEPIHLALIDGCHGKLCATLDFLALEAFIVRGGTMMFHDIGKDQRFQPQPHCAGGIDVWGACYDLGLLTGKRKGWQFLEILSGRKEQGGWDMGVFEKVK
jgi:hypothetical protein